MILFLSSLDNLLYDVYIIEKSPLHAAQVACFLPSVLSRYQFIHFCWEEQFRVKCLSQGHRTQPHGFELMTLALWVRIYTIEVHVTLWNTCFFHRFNSKSEWKTNKQINKQNWHQIRKLNTSCTKLHSIFVLFFLPIRSSKKVWFSFFPLYAALHVLIV